MSTKRSHMAAPEDAICFDVLIVGGGPAGISCALECQDSKLSSVILEERLHLGGQLHQVPGPIPNFAGGRFRDGDELQSFMEVAAESSGARINLDTQVESIDLEAHLARTSKGTFFGAAVVLATGARNKELNAVGTERFSQDIFYRTGKHQLDLSGHNIVIVGGGDSALLEALERADSSLSTTVIHRSGRFRARPDLVRAVKDEERIQLLEHFEVLELLGEDHLRAVKVRSTLAGAAETIPAEKIVVKIGYSPNTELFAGQVDMDEDRRVRIAPDGSTSVPGVFACGDIATPGYDRIATAIGQGMMAAGGLRSYLEPLMVERYGLQ